MQRVPVRIKLDARELAEHPLRIGLSMEADVEVADQSGQALAKSNSKQSELIATETSDVDAEIDKIIAANLGEKASKKDGKAH